MVVGAAHHDTAQHGVEVLVAVADEVGVMPGPAVDPRPAVPGVGGQQLLQQRRAQLGHRGADRQLHRGQARTRGAQRGGRERGQPLYLGGELRRDLRVEPPFSSPVAAGGAVAAGFGGRASQISSLTATICSLTSAKRW